MRPRWDGDTRGAGVTSGQWIAPSVSEFGDALAKADWITESPETHILQHIQHASAVPNAAWRIGRALTKDHIFEVDLVWTKDSASIRELRSDLFALVGAFSESTTFVRQVVAEGGLEFHIATGEVGRDTAFTDHGHVIQIYVTARRMSEILSGRPG